MQTLHEYVLGANRQFPPNDQCQIVVNPSFLYRLTHTAFAAYLTPALVIGAKGDFAERLGVSRFGTTQKPDLYIRNEADANEPLQDSMDPNSRELQEFLRVL